MKKRTVAKVLTRKSATTRKMGITRAAKPGKNLKIKGLKRFI